MSILADKSYKMYISLKEVNESRYWIRLLTDCKYINEKMSKNIFDDVEELIKMLTSSINTTKEKLNV